jgi:formylglycine-generating enzyme required for sulfatase activity
MSDLFDPYRVWLGIPPESRPPTHYELLGISASETEAAVINAAVVRQSTYVRNFQIGKNAADANRILNEIAAAKVCLLDPAKRANYDAEIRLRPKAVAAAVPPVAPPSPAPVGLSDNIDLLMAAPLRMSPTPADVAPPRHAATLGSASNRQRSQFVWQFSARSALTLAILLTILALWQRKADEPSPVTAASAPKLGSAQGDVQSTESGAHPPLDYRVAPAHTPPPVDVTLDPAKTAEVKPSPADDKNSKRGRGLAADDTDTNPKRQRGEEQPRATAVPADARPTRADNETRKTEDPRVETSPPIPKSKIENPKPARQPAADGAWPADAPPPAIAPFDEEQARQHQQAWADYLKLPQEYTNSVGMKFVLIPPGEFTMGSTAEEIKETLKHVHPNDWHWQGYIKSEAPRHKVVLARPFYVAVHEVTQKEYEAVMGANPSYFAKTRPGEQQRQQIADLDTANFPVENVSWNDAAEFCAKLSKQQELKPFYFRAGETVTGLKGTGYRLPTEAEWEFACRAGTSTKFWNGDASPAGWFLDNSGGRTHEVEELASNAFGLFDVHGNVWEWVEDSCQRTFYGRFVKKPAIDPQSPFSAGAQRVIRGGDWSYFTSYCRSASRNAYGPTYRGTGIGFRVVLVAVLPRASR